MRRKVWWVVLLVALLAVFFLPIPNGQLKDGGTRVYTALTYKLVRWQRLTAAGRHDATRIYWFPQNFRSLDGLWAQEEENVRQTVTGKIVKIEGQLVSIEPVAGEFGGYDLLQFSSADLPDIGAQVGSCVEVTFRGGIMEIYPAQIRPVSWERAEE